MATLRVSVGGMGGEELAAFVLDMSRCNDAWRVAKAIALELEQHTGVPEEYQRLLLPGGELLPQPSISARPPAAQPPPEWVAALTAATATPDAAAQPVLSLVLIAMAPSPRDLEMGQLASGHGCRARYLLKARADPEGKTAAGLSPLVHAVRYGYDEVLQALLEAAADPNRVTVHNPAPRLFPEDDNSPLLHAVHYASPSATRILLQARADPLQDNASSGDFPLWVAVQPGQPMRTVFSIGKARAVNSFEAKVECARALLEARADPGHVRRKQGGFPLLPAVVRSGDTLARLLLEARADPMQVCTRSGDFPLLVAARGGRHACVRALLEAAADPSQLNAKLDSFPLLLAVRHSSDATASLLLGARADPGQTDMKVGNFALLEAVRTAATRGLGEDSSASISSCCCVQLLLKSRADPRQTNKQDGQFPLLFAAARGAEACVRLLLQARADAFQVEQGSGDTPLAAASRAEHRGCVQALLEPVQGVLQPLADEEVKSPMYDESDPGTDEVVDDDVDSEASDSDKHCSA